MVFQVYLQETYQGARDRKAENICAEVSQMPMNEDQKHKNTVDAKCYQ